MFRAAILRTPKLNPRSDPELIGNPVVLVDVANQPQYVQFAPCEGFLFEMLGVWVANSQSGGDRDLKLPTTVLAPSVVIKRSICGGGRSGVLRWRGAGECAMNAMRVVIVSELSQLPR